MWLYHLYFSEPFRTLQRWFLPGVFGIALFNGTVFTNQLQLSFSQHSKGYHHSQTVPDSLHIFLSSGQIRFSPRSFCQYRAQTANEGCAPPPPHKTHSDLDVSLSVQPWVSVPFYIVLNVSSKHLFSITSYVQCFVFLNTRKCIIMLTRDACAITQRAIFAATNIQIVYYNLNTPIQF